MATTSYFEAEIPVAGRDGKADRSAPKSTVEVLVSSYSGTHQIYLKWIGPQGEEKVLVLDKQHAVGLLDGIERAATYLGYVK